MKIEDKFPFVTDLIGPRHQESLIRPEAAGADGDIEIDESWSINLDSEDDIAKKAATELATFLAGAMELPLEDENPDCSITLAVNASVGQHPEAHSVVVSDGEVRVVGAGPEGILRGVFLLESFMKERGGPYLPIGRHSRRPLFAHRIHRSPISPFYVDELTGYKGPPFETKSRDVECRYPAFEAEDAGPGTFYHDNMLLKLAEQGANGIWLRGALRHFAKVDVFPEFGERSDEMLAALRDMCERAATFGMKVFLYLNEPMGLDEDDPFWDKYPHVRGVTMARRPISCMCTSTDEVKAYLRQSSEYVFAQVPDLAGLILITASEYPSHCYSHQTRPDEQAELEKFIEQGQICERCATRTPQEVVAEVVTLLNDGAKSGNPDAQVIAWNWSWSFYEEDPQMGVLERLPEDVIVMGGFERGEPTQACDFEYTNDEYSIKVVGPSSRFKGTMDYQRKHGRPMYAKLQLGTTHENSTVPYLPALHNVARKYKALKDNHVAGMMTCWNFGNMPSTGLEVAGEFSWAPQPEIEEGLLAVARRNFGSDAAADVVEGWRLITEAHSDFPGSIPVLYYGPVSRGPAFHFIWDQIDRKFPRSWLLDTEIEGDRLNDWTSPFGPEKVSECYRTVAENWLDGIKRMEQGLEKTSGPDRNRLEREIGVARICRIQLISGANVVDFLLARDEMYSESDPERKRDLLERLEQICRDEVQNARAAIPLCEADSRLGFHGEAYGYLFNRDLIEEKLEGLQEILENRIPEMRRSLD